MNKDRYPMTPALRLLKERGVVPEVRAYRYEDKGGTAVAARELGVEEHMVIKTLVFEDEHKQPLLMLMHGDAQVSTKSLARSIGAKAITPCQPADAARHTGYQVGGISPFGTRKSLPVFLEKTILDLERIIINAGKRGLLMAIPSDTLIEVLNGKPVTVAIVD